MQHWAGADVFVYRVDEKRGVEQTQTPKDEATPQEAEKPKKDKAKKAK